MLHSSFGFTKMNKISKKQMEVNLRKLNKTQTFPEKQQLKERPVTSRINRQNKQQSSRNCGYALSARNKQNVPSQENGSTFNQYSLKLQQTCLTEFSLDKGNHCSSRSRSKRKKTQTHLFNFSATNVNQQSNIKDKYIRSFISNNESSFSDTLSQVKSQLFTQSTLQYSNKSCVGQDKYEKIRNTMKKMKNLTEIKSFKRKSSRLNTTEQQWNEIENLVRLACREENKRVETEQTLATDNVQTQQEVKQEYVSIEEKPQEKVPQCQKKQTPRLSRKLLSTKNYQNISQKKQPIVIASKSKIKTVKIIENQTAKCHQNTESKKDIKMQPLSFPQFYSLLLIFQHTLYTVPAIIDKVVSLCKQYELQNKVSIYLFFKHLYLLKKLIEIVIDQMEDKFFHQQETYDYAQVVQQIKNCNRKNFSFLNKLQGNIDAQSGICVSPQSLKLPTDNETLQSLSQGIKNLQKDFHLSNMKVIKKLLKKISKSPKTNIKQFHVFLNYSSCFLNLSRVHQNIQKVLQNTMTVQRVKRKSIHKSQCNQEMEKMLTKEFLYKECEFIQNKYLHTKEKVFEMYFEIDDEHKKIQDYYHLVIKQLKSIETKTKQKM